MTIEKLPSGSYRIREMINGKRYSTTVKYKPKKQEAEAIINELVMGKNSFIPYKKTVCELANEYIVKCIQIGRSPTTISSYKSIVKNTPEWFLDLSIKNLNQSYIQSMIDEYSKTHSAKSTYNLNGFYKCVLQDKLTYKTKLPKREKSVEYEPTTKDVQKILEFSKGTRYECAINLACIGLRRGEAVCITAKDLDGDVLTINKDMIYDDGLYVVKNTPKTAASNRRIKIPHSLAELIRKQGKAFEGNPHTINEFLHKAQDSLGIPRFRLHTLRHFAGASLHKNGFSDRQIMSYLGWDTITTLHNVYNYNLDPEDSQRDLADSFSKIIDV